MLQYDTANGLAIDYTNEREHGRWRGSIKREHLEEDKGGASV